MPPALTTKWVASSGAIWSWSLTPEVTEPSMALSVARAPSGKALAELFDHIGADPDIGAVGEDRVAEQDDMLAVRLRGGAACGQ